MIEIKSVTKKYGDFTAIEDISLTVEDCSVLGLAGFNGCGKTTLLNVCAGIFKADSGAVYLDGADVFDNDVERQNLFYVSDELWFPVGANIKTCVFLFVTSTFSIAGIPNAAVFPVPVCDNPIKSNPSCISGIAFD